MEDLLRQYPDREAFDAFFHMNYKPVVYEDVKDAMEAFVKEAGLSLFFDEYVKSGNINEKNPDIYETAFALYELAPQESAAITRTFHEAYAKSYAECLDQLFDRAITPLL